MFVNSPFIEWFESWGLRQVNNPDFTDADIFKSAFMAFVAEHNLNDNDYYLLGLIAGDLISERSAFVSRECVQLPTPPASGSNPDQG
jgi:hypothetical protein